MIPQCGLKNNTKLAESCIHTKVLLLASYIDAIVCPICRNIHFKSWRQTLFYQKILNIVLWYVYINKFKEDKTYYVFLFIKYLDMIIISAEQHGVDIITKLPELVCCVTISLSLGWRRITWALVAKVIQHCPKQSDIAIQHATQWLFCFAILHFSSFISK